MPGHSHFWAQLRRWVGWDWVPQTPAERDKDRLKIKFRAAAGGRQQIEVKVKCPASEAKQQQLYSLEFFFFFPKELEAVRLSGFYSDLWEVVRLHPPKMTLAALSSNDERAGVSGIKALLQEAQEGKQPADKAAVFMLRLVACTMRRAMRKAAQKIQAQLSDAAGISSQAGDIESIVGAAASMVSEFVTDVCKAVESLQEACQPCTWPGAAGELPETWALCEEWLLVEAERAALRLMQDIDIFQTTIWRARHSPELAALRQLQPQQPTSVWASGSQAPLYSSGLPSRSPLDLLAARMQLQHTAVSFQAARCQRGYVDSLIRPGDRHNNEHFTHRIKILKRNGQEAINLIPRVRQQSQLLNDVVGSVVAAVAMVVAVFGLWIGYRIADNQLNIKFAIVTVVIYSIKDRIKKWGERYLEPVASWCGYTFPDRIIQLIDEGGSVVGLCQEICGTADDSSVEKEVAAFRWKEDTPNPSRHQAAMPERVVHLRKRMQVDWSALSRPLQNVQGLDDVMRFDLQHFCRRMEPASEPHLCIRHGLDGSSGVDILACARVYHVNLVLKVTQLKPSDERGEPYVQLEGARLILDQGGLVRLERLGATTLSGTGPKKDHPLPEAPNFPEVQQSFGGSTPAHFQGRIGENCSTSVRPGSHSAANLI